MDIYESKIADALDYVYNVFKNGSSTNISAIFKAYKVPTWYATRLKIDGHLVREMGGKRGKAIYKWVTNQPGNILAKSLRMAYLKDHKIELSERLLSKKHNIKELNRKVDLIIELLTKQKQS